MLSIGRSSASPPGHGQQYVGLVMGAVTFAGARSVVPVGRIRAPDGAAPRADSLFKIGSVTKVFTALLLAEAVTRGELGAGALRSTATDMLTFLHVQLRPDKTPLGPAIALTHPEPPRQATRHRARLAAGEGRATASCSGTTAAPARQRKH